MDARKKGVTRLGDYNTICPVCGWKYKASEMKKRWDGVMVCPTDWETRNILDFFRTRPDQHPLPFVLPDLEDVPSSESGFHLADGTATGFANNARFNSEFNFSFPITIEFWCYAVAGSLGTVFRNIVRNENYWIVQNQTGGQAGKFRFIIFQTPTGNAYSFPMAYVVPQDSVWRKFEFTAADNTQATVNVYGLDGTVLATETIAPSNLGTIGNPLNTFVSIGGTLLDAAGSWNGGIDELRVWNTVRSAQDLATYRFTEISGGEDYLIMYLNFNCDNRFQWDNKKYGSMYTGSQGFRFSYPHVQFANNTFMNP